MKLAGRVMGIGGSRFIACALVVASLLWSCGTEEDEPRTEIRVGQQASTTSLDPALATPAGGWLPSAMVYTPLLAYRHAEGEEGIELIPGLAEALPEISADATTYRLRLRDGLEYSDGEPVRASDFEHTVRRILSLDSPARRLYSVIEGAGEYLSSGDPGGDISGITTDDETGRITISLTRPQADLASALASPYAGLVPASTPFEDARDDPPPGVGPYEIGRPSSSGELTLRRSRSFDELNIPDIPTGEADRIAVVHEVGAATQTRRVLGGALDFAADRPPASMLPRVLDQATDRFGEFITTSTEYFFLNGTRPPFDDPRVREVVNYAIDKPALAKVSGGEFAPGCSFLPPDLPGYDASIDGAECPYGDPNQSPDPKRGKAMLRRTGAEGAKVMVWGTRDRRERRITALYAKTLNRVGLDAKQRLVSPAAYARAIGRRRPAPQTGYLSVAPIVPHPLAFYAAIGAVPGGPVAGVRGIGIEDPLVDDEIDRLNLETDLESVAEDWAVLDEYVISPPQSYLAPVGHGTATTLMSERMDFGTCALEHPVYLNDYSSWCLKEGEE